MNFFRSLFNAWTGTVTDWTRANQTLREGDFGSDQDSSHLQLSLSPLSQFRSSSVTIHRSSPMLVWKMPTPGHGDSDGSWISTSTILTRCRDYMTHHRSQTSPDERLGHCVDFTHLLSGMNPPWSGPDHSNSSQWQEEQTSPRRHTEICTGSTRCHDCHC